MRDLIVDVVRLAALVGKALALRVDPHGVRADELGLPGGDGAVQDAVGTAVADVACADVEAHLDGLARAAHADLGVDALVVGHVLGNHVVVAREAARGDDDLLRLVLVQLLGASAREDADDGAVLDDEGLGRGLVVELDADLVCLLRHCRDGNVRVRVDVVAARNRVDGLLRDLLLERNAQLDVEPVDRLAKVVGAELLHVVVELVAATAQEVLQQRLGRVLDTLRLLQLRTRAVQRADGKRARPGDPPHLLDQDDLRTRLAGLLRRGDAGSAGTDDEHVAVNRLARLLVCLHLVDGFWRTAHKRAQRGNGTRARSELDEPAPAHTSIAHARTPLPFLLVPS